MNIRDLFGTFAPQADPNAPADPFFNRREAGWHLAGGALQGLGAGLMTGDWNRALQINNSAVDDYRTMKREKWTAARLKEEAELKRQERERADADRKRREDYINTLPADVRMKALSIPGYLDSWISANDPDLQQAPELTADMRNFQFAQSNPEFAGFLEGGRNSNGVLAQVQERQIAAEQLGLTPDDPAYNSFILTGKMPREDQAPLTATDKKAILDADDAVQANRTVIDQLTSVVTKDPATGLSLNDRAGSGSLAGTQSWIARNDPTGFFDDGKGQATTELQNIVLNQALASLKSIFGSAPTEGERQILVDLQASIDKTPQEREPIIKRAISMAKARLDFNQNRANSLRGGSYYKSGGGPATTEDGITIEQIGD